MIVSHEGCLVQKSGSKVEMKVGRAKMMYEVATRSIVFVPLLASFLISASCTQKSKGSIRLNVSPPTTILTIQHRIRVVAAYKNLHLAVGTDGGDLLIADLRKKSVHWLHRTRPASSQGIGKGPLHHDTIVTGVSFSPDGATLVSTSGPNIVWWDTAERQMIKQLTGPHQLTGVAFGPKNDAAFFSTIQGHVFRWKMDASEADLVTDFACSGTRVARDRMRLPPNERCPYGTFVTTEDGRFVCTYAVTHLVLSGNFIGRACREGVFGLLDGRDASMRFLTAGAVRTVSLLGDNALLVGRLDHHLRVYKFTAKRTYRELAPPDRYHASALAPQLAAAVAARILRIWHWPTGKLLYTHAFEDPPIWLKFSEPGEQLHVVFRNGRYLYFRLTLIGAS